MKIIRNYAYLLIALLIMVPVIRLLGLIRDGQFSTWFGSWSFINRASALMAITALALNVILSARTKWLDKFFHGADKLYKAHHWTGALALVFALFHPLARATAFAPSWQDSLEQLFPILGSNWDKALLLGIGSLASMILLLIFTFYLRLSYEWWHKIHKYLGIPLLLALLHVWFIGSDVGRDDFLKAYILGLLFAAIAAYCYRTLFGRRLVRRTLATVSQITKQGKVTFIRLKPKYGTFKFHAGQFVYLTFLSAGVANQAHPFTIASSPTQPELDFVIKELGDFSSEANKIQVDTKVLLEGPYGGFDYQRLKPGRLIWIAGGIGITPFMSMMKQMAISSSNKPKVDLFYCTPTAAEALDLPLLENVAVHIHDKSRQGGHLKAVKIRSIIGNDFTSCQVMLCGPEKMMADLTRQLVSLGISKANIYKEEFNII